MKVPKKYTRKKQKAAITASGHRVVAGTAPRITAENAPNSKAKPLNGSVLDDGFLGILAARRGKTTGRRCKRADTGLVETDGQHQEPDKDSSDKQDRGSHNLHVFGEARSVVSSFPSSFPTLAATSAVGR